MQKTQRQLQSEQTKQKIITEAIRLFVRKGFYGTSISDLAQVTGLTKGALYHHFENKDALFFAVIESVRTSWYNEVGQEVLQNNDALIQLTTLLDSHTRLLQKDDAICIVLNVLIMEMEDINPKFTVALQEIYDELIEFVEHIIKKGQRTGQIKPDLDTQLTTFNIVGVLKVIGCSNIFNHLDVDYIAMTETWKQILLDGLRS